MAEIPPPIEFGFRRPRILDDRPESTPQDSPLRDTERVSQRMLNEIYSSYQRSSDKANFIMQSAANVAKKYVIPVPQESSEIIQAVTRQDPDSDGRSISFDTFTRMIDKVESMATKVDYSVIDDQVIADPLANSRTIRKKLGSEFDGEDGDLLGLIMVAGHIMILYLMHQIQGMWRGMEKVSASPKVAGPYPVEQSSAISEALLEATTGLAVSFTVLGLNQTLATAFLDQGNQRHNDSASLTGAISKARQVDLPPLVKILQKAMGIDDYKIIIRYCVKYIAQSKDRGYEFWWAYMVARKTRYLSARSLNSAPTFSKKHYSATNINYTVDDALVDPDDIQLTPPSSGGFSPPSLIEGLSTDLVRGLNDSITYPTDEFLCIRDYEATAFEVGLNQVAQIMDTRLSRDVICCLVRFLAHVDLDTLKRIRGVLGIFLNAQIIDLDATLENFMSFLVGWVRETVVQMITDLVQSIIDKVLRVISEFLRDIAVDLGHLEQCPLILELVQGIVDAVDLMLEDIKEITFNYINSVELNVSVSFGIAGVSGGRRPSGLLRVHKKRSIRRLLSIIDSIIGIIEESVTICDTEQSQNLDDSKTKFITYDQILDSPLINDIEDYLNISPEIKSRYFSDAIAVELEDGSEIPSYDIGEYQIRDPVSDETQNCDIGFSDKIIQRILRVHNGDTSE